MTAREQIENVEAVSAIDGSMGWCTHINSEINGLIVRRMELALCDKIFDDWDALVCSGHGPPNGPNPGTTARREGDGWRLHYQGSFASGCHNATWNFLMSPIAIDEATGEGTTASFMIPRGEFEIVDTWDTAGMRGSGSHDVRMDGAYVPPEHLLPARPLWPAYLACAHAAQAARHVVGIINNTAGTTGSRLESPLERHLRDAQQAATHALISWRHYEDIGKTFVGHDPSPTYRELRRA